MAAAFVAAFLVVVLAGLALCSDRDAASLLTCFVVALLLVPARLVVPGLGGIGTPANLVALAMLAWWVMAVLAPSLGMPRSRQPIRFAVLAYASVMVLSYALAYLRPLTDLEVSGADRAMVNLVAAVGIALLCADGLGTHARLETLLRRVVLLVSVVALIGILQFLLRLDLVPFLRPPGLVENIEIQAFKGRSQFTRPYSTALHPIELSVVIAMILPLAIHFAVVCREGPGRLARWALVAVLATATLMSVSRSGVLGFAVGMLVLAGGWSWRRRLNALVLLLLFLGAVRAAVPGLVGTLRNLFLNAEDDPSIQGRLDDIRGVRTALNQAPWIGGGRGTWNSEEDTVLDNEYYRMLMDAGLLGLLALMLLLACGLVVARRVAMHAADADDRSLGRALLASIAVAAISLATFDALAYPMFSGLLFLLLGATGATWRLAREGEVDSPRSGQTPAAIPTAV